MTISTCPEPLKLKQLLHGRLDEASAESIAVHLEDCSDCQGKLQVFEQEPFDLGIDEAALSQGNLGFEQESACRWATALAMEVVQDSPSSETHGDFELPMELGDYRLLEPVAKGGMGVVYRAQHMRLGREVAVKIIAGARLSDKRTLQRFEAEMRALGRLSHPNIVAALDARELAGQPVLIMEFVNGLALNEIVRRLGPLPADCVAAIGRSVAAALEYASRNGLIHRDVKPSNIMINESGEVKLLDLGLARFQLSQQEADDRTTTGFALGTADYMSPEQIQDARNVDVRSDLYSLGCTLFKLLTGKVPYDDERYVTNFAKLSAHVAQEPIVIPSKFKTASIELVQIIEHLTAKSITDRPTTAQDVSLRLDKLASTADLARLVNVAKRTALQIKHESPSAELPKSKPIVASGKRFVPPWLGWCVAASLLPIGIWLGTWLTVEKADGTKTRVELPNNATASISEAGDINVKTGTSANGWNSASPNQFGTYGQPVYGPTPPPGYGYNESINPYLTNPPQAARWDPTTGVYAPHESSVLIRPSEGAPPTPSKPMTKGSFGNATVDPDRNTKRSETAPPKVAPQNETFGANHPGPNLNLPETNEQLSKLAQQTAPIDSPSDKPSKDAASGQTSIESIAAQAAQEEKRKEAKKRLPRTLSNVNDSSVSQADVNSAIDAAMASADTSTDPVYLGYPFTKWMNLFNKDRSSDIMLTSGKAILILADTPEQKSQAAKALLERCRQYGGRVIDGGGSVSGSWMEFLYEEFPKLFPDPGLDAITYELNNGNLKSFNACELLVNKATENFGEGSDRRGVDWDAYQRSEKGPSFPSKIQELIAAWKEARKREGIDNDQDGGMKQSLDCLMRLTWRAKIPFEELPSGLQAFAKAAWFREKKFGTGVHGSFREMKPSEVYPYHDFAEAWLSYWMTLSSNEQQPVIIVRKLFEEEEASRTFSSLSQAYGIDYKRLLAKIDKLTPEDSLAVRKFLVDRFADSHFDRSDSKYQAWPSILRWLADTSQIKAENVDKATTLLRETEASLNELSKLLENSNREVSQSNDPFGTTPKNNSVEEYYAEMNKALARFCAYLEVEPAVQQKKFRIRYGWVGTGYGQTMDEQGNVLQSSGAGGGGMGGMGGGMF